MKDGIYNALALALYPGPFWPVSVALVAQAHFGAGSSGKSFTTAEATRSAIDDPEAPAPSQPQAAEPSSTLPHRKTLPGPAMEQALQELEA